jgi:hypothetical protein
MRVWAGQKLPFHQVGSQTLSERLIAEIFALGQRHRMRGRLHQKVLLGFPSPPAALPTPLLLASPLVHPMSVGIVLGTRLQARVVDALFFFQSRQDHSTWVRVMPLERQLASLQRVQIEPVGMNEPRCLSPMSEIGAELERVVAQRRPRLGVDRHSLRATESSALWAVENSVEQAREV